MTGQVAHPFATAISVFRSTGSDWRETISPRLNVLVVQELGWMFRHLPGPCDGTPE